MTLSVCCLTTDRPAMVAALLAAYRTVADEIVVAVDSRVRPDALGPLHAVADTVLRFEYAGTPERSRAWLIAQCHGEFVLMVDGDEVPSRALLDALPELARPGSGAQFRIARRWCWPGVESWIDERPWFPDLQRRMVAVGSGVDVDVRFHGGIRERLPVRVVMEPIYHLAFLLRTLAERRAIAAGYEAARPGVLAVGGGDMNDVLYAPEHHATLRPAPTPDDDIALLTAVLDAPDADPVDHVPPVVPADEIARHATADPLASGGYSVVLDVVERDLRTEPDFNTTVLVAVANTGRATIPHADIAGAQVRMCARVLDRRPGSPEPAWSRTPLLCDIPPGETRVIECTVLAPPAPGIYTVEFDLLNENTRWFGCVRTAELVVATRWGRVQLGRWEHRDGATPTG